MSQVLVYSIPACSLHDQQHVKALLKSNRVECIRISVLSPEKLCSSYSSDLSVPCKTTIILLDDLSSSIRVPIPFRHRILVSTKESDWVQSAVVDIVHRLHQSPLQFISTRAKDPAAIRVTFLEVVLNGLAPDGGLYVPVDLSDHLSRLFSKSELGVILTAPIKGNPETYGFMLIAQLVLERLVDLEELPPVRLSTMIQQAYQPELWQADNAYTVCRVSELSEVWLLELYHGPTAAFKDFALQLFAQLFTLSVSAASAKGDNIDNALILTATSGDTGVSTMEGFRCQAPQIPISVLYPFGGVSAVQELQMMSGKDKACVLPIQGDFDACQSMVKNLFTDTEWSQKLHDEFNMSLSSANSINWGRLLPQIAFHVWGYRQLVQQTASSQRDHFPLVDICVPCGNFGNILTAFYARRFLPIRRLVVASNTNDALYRFIQSVQSADQSTSPTTTAVFDLRSTHLVLTSSPSIDILRASNMERLLHDVSKGDGSLIAKLFEDASNFFELSKSEQGDMIHEIATTFQAGRCNEAECEVTIAHVASQEGRLIDPHTAVAMQVAGQIKKSVPMMVVSTAHWSKFPKTIAEALGLNEGDDRTVEGVRKLHDNITKHMGCQVAHPLQRLIESASADQDTYTPLKTEKEVKQAIESFLRARRLDQT